MVEINKEDSLWNFISMIQKKLNKSYLYAY